jgi:hypothetical protein
MRSGEAMSVAVPAPDRPLGVLDAIVVLYLLEARAQIDRIMFLWEYGSYENDA